jgi:pimeloyl-ACP methyl ester carboxylesterase
VTLPFVLVHGGAHGAWCWQPLVPHLAGTVLAVDLPPKAVRGVTPAALGTPPPELNTIGVDDFAASAIADVDAAGIERFVLVGHSMGGLTIAEIARRIPARVARLVFVSCIVPPEGGNVIDTLPAEVREMTRDAVAEAQRGGTNPMGGLDEGTIRRMFCNDMDEGQARFVLDHTGVEAAAAFADPVTRSGIPPELPTTYVRLLQDQALAPDDQDAQIAHLRESPGSTVDVVELDAGHDVMISAPERLAAVLGPLAAEASARGG